jgi:hypothetical protein
VAKVLRARRLNFLSALSKEGGKLAASKKQKAKRVHSLQREDFTSGKVEEFIYFGNSSNMHFYLHFIPYNNF